MVDQIARYSLSKISVDLNDHVVRIPYPLWSHSVHFQSQDGSKLHQFHGEIVDLKPKMYELGCKTLDQLSRGLN